MNTPSLLALLSVVCFASASLGASTALQEEAAPKPRPRVPEVDARYLAAPGFTELYEEEVVLPMTAFGSRPLIAVEIDGEGPFEFILDTGSSFSALIDRELIEQLGLDTGEEVAVPGLKGEGLLIDSLLFEGLEMTEVHAVACDVAGIFRGARSAPRGILGIGLFADCLLTFDFPGKRYVVREGELPGTGAGVVPALPGQRASFEVEVGDLRIPVHMDTGSPGGLMLTSDYEARLPLTAEPVAAGQIRTPMGSAMARDATLDGVLRLAGHDFERPTVRFADLPQMVSNGVGNVGVGLLGQFAITFDQENQRLRFQRGPADGG